jgi:hypothetical protein
MIIEILFALVAQTASPEKPIDWRAAATADVEAAYAETAENHPGMWDRSNPSFRALLKEARTEALKLAKRTSTAGGFEASLARFRAVIDDGHAGAASNVPEKFAAARRWPGFMAAWRGDAMYVYKSDISSIPEGARIDSCDDIPIKSLIEQNVFRFRAGGKTPGNWWSDALRLFVDDGNPFVRLPKTCRLFSSSSYAEHQIQWRALPDDYQTLKNGSANGERLTVGISEPKPGLFWIGIQDFQPNDDDAKLYQKLYSDIDSLRNKLLSARAVILDLRFNRGGSSTWSRTLAERLWGADRVERQMQHHNRNIQIWWRPTAANKKALEAYRETFLKQNNLEVVAHFDEIITGFAQAKKSNERFWIQPREKSVDMNPPATTLPSDPPELNTPVYVIVPGQCGSACLDALDCFTRFRNTKLIGAPSSSDSTYMEVRQGQLPSGMGTVIIPMKIWVDRPRGNGAHYAPGILMTDLDWSTASFQKRIEADLNGP